MFTDEEGRRSTTSAQDVPGRETTGPRPRELSATSAELWALPRQPSSRAAARDEFSGGP